MKKTSVPCYIDIYAGCGGLSLGLFKAGWRGIFAIEKSKMAFETLKHNLIDKKKHFDWPSWLPVTEHDINEVLKNHRNELEKLNGKVDLVAGGPPCQGFSLAGRRNKNDERNKLVDSYIEFIRIVKPRILFFENVKGFTIGFKNKKSRGEAYSDYVLRELGKLGYKVHAKIIDFSNYGIPQRRKRFILVGMLEGSPELFFTNIDQDKIEFLKNKGLKAKVTLGEAISDLERKHGEITSVFSKKFKEGFYGEPESDYQKLLRKNPIGKLPDSHRFAKHKKETIVKFEYFLKNCPRDKNISVEIKNKFILNKKCIIPLGKNTQSPTLTTLPDDYIHYSEPRILTVREYARIQSFDDWFEFKDKYTTGGKRRKGEVPRYTQVGNAIPPLFVELSGIVLKAMT
ncbi:Modification methylase MthTI [uncultured archaeon]|nr:Modification methylase MthTI [uncultured archaeon]